MGEATASWKISSLATLSLTNERLELAPPSLLQSLPGHHCSQNLSGQPSQESCLWAPCTQQPGLRTRDPWLPQRTTQT